MVALACVLYGFFCLILLWAAVEFFRARSERRGYARMIREHEGRWRAIWDEHVRLSQAKPEPTPSWDANGSPVEGA